MRCSRNFLALAAWMVFSPLGGFRSGGAEGSGGAGSSEGGGVGTPGVTVPGDSSVEPPPGGAARPDEKPKKPKDSRKDKEKSRESRHDGGGKNDTKGKPAAPRDGKPPKMSLPI